MPNHHKRHNPGRSASSDPPQDTPGTPEQPTEAGTPAAVAAPPAAPPVAAPAPPSQPPRETLKITDLKDLSIQKLTQIAKEKNVAGATGMRKQDLIFQILKAQTEQSGFIFSEG